MTIPFSGIPAPVQGVTGGQGLPQGVAAIEGDTGNVVFTPPSNVLQLRKGAIPQSLQIYETYTSATDFIRIEIEANSGGPFRVRTEQQGSGIARPLILGAGNTDYWIVNTTGHLTPFASSGYDIGSLSAFVRSIYVGVSINMAAVVSLRAGTGVPAVGLGANGDVYFNQTGAALTTIYQKRAGAWVGIV